MNLKQKEILVKVLVEEVINKLITSGKLLEFKINSFEVNEKKWTFEKTLIIAEDIELVVKNNYKEISITNKTIITPLAYDIIKDNGIKVSKYFLEKQISKREKTLVKNSFKEIAILSNSYDEVYQIKTKQILEKLGIEAGCIKPKNFTTTEMEFSINNLSENILSGKYKYGVVINNDSFNLMKCIKKNNGLKTKICWEISGDKVCTEKSNILFVNSSLIGFKKLEEKLKLWLKYNKE